jgi:hypothetical protein
MQVIPLSAVPSQALNVNLAGQACKITVSQKSTGVFLDLLVSNAPIIQGVLCPDRKLLVRNAYLGFIGDLAFADTQGADDPDYTGFGSRFLLLYLEASDL